LLFNGIGVMDVHDRAARGRRNLSMKTYTIDSENNISAFATSEEAAAAGTTPVDTFASQKELVELTKDWPAERFVAIWNSLSGVTPVESFKSAKVAIGRIWPRVQKLGVSAESEKKPKAKGKATGRAHAAKGAPSKGKPGTKATTTKAAPKAKKAAKAREPREGSKQAQVVAVLERKDGATITEIMKKMGWQRHTVRGFMAGAMKKAGYKVESFKPEGGERSYRIK